MNKSLSALLAVKCKAKDARLLGRRALGVSGLGCRFLWFKITGLPISTLQVFIMTPSSTAPKQMSSQTLEMGFGFLVRFEKILWRFRLSF